MVTRRRLSSLLAGATVAGALPGAARAGGEGWRQPYQGVAFDAFVAARLREYEVPGAVVAIVTADGPVFLKGFGIRRIGAAGGVDENTRFQIASVSKFVTATTLGELVDQGVIAWDTPARTYHPDLRLAVPYASENATLRDFLAHRTGLPAYAGDLLAALGYGADDLVRRARHLPFDRSFRAGYAYSNYGVFLGQAAAARAAGVSPPDVLARMFGALGMTRSGPTRSVLFEDENRAAAHDIDGSIMPFENVDSFSGAGAAVSSGADFGRWMRMLLALGILGDRRVLAEATVDAIFAASMPQGPGGPLSDPNASAGLGCDSYRFLTERIVEKNGALNGMRTIVTLIPDRRIGIAVFANKQLTLFPEAIRAEFLEREIGRSGQDLQARVREEQANWLKLIEPPRRPAAPLPASHKREAFAGRYASALYGTMEIVVANDGLLLTIGPRHYPARLEHWSGDAFLLSFENPDIPPGLLAFVIEGSRITGINGSRIPGAFTADYGRFERR